MPPGNPPVQASRGDRTRTCNPRFWRPVRYQLRHAPGLRGSVPLAVPGRPALAPGCEDARMQRLALAVLFAVIALALAAVAVWSALEGGRAWVIALASGGLALWMADLARRAGSRRRE